MLRLDFQACDRATLEGVAKSLARTIDRGNTHNEDGVDLRDLLEQVFKLIEAAPDRNLIRQRHQ
jgi:hypothetical protein